MFVKKIGNEIKLDIICVKNCIKYLMNRERYLLLEASVQYDFNGLIHSNWGDDVNFSLVRLISNKIPLYYPNTKLSRLLPVDRYMAIGSTLTFLPLIHTTVWGSGIINENKISKIKSKPKRVMAVRGPKTRNALINIGIECPKIYGDPALLFPLFYKPNINRKYKMGIIPHYMDFDKECVKKISSWEGIHLIRVDQYENWNDFIDQICSCDFVVSSSLHGIIIAEAYGIPSLWCEFGSYVKGWEFKFNDFYEGINKLGIEPFYVSLETNYDILKKEIQNWTRASYDTDALLKSCPFLSKDKVGYD